MIRLALTLIATVALPVVGSQAAEQLTSLSQPDPEFEIVNEHYVELSRGPLQITVVDNAALDLPQLPKHRAGYNGVARLVHKQHPHNLFVPGIAGLNFEHIHDGTTRNLVEKFEPRKFPMQLRRLSEFVIEVYQPPTGNFQLESCGRYTLRDDGVIEYDFECRPHRDSFQEQLIGLFWASYIHQPQDKAIWFRGRSIGTASDELLRAETPRHGVNSTHGPVKATLPSIDADFPLTLVNHPSRLEYVEPWFYGISQGLAFVQVFRPQDGIWIAQSPSGGGNGNPAWDFQWFIHNAKVGQVYGLRVKAAVVPFKSHEQVQRVARRLAQEFKHE